VTAAGGGAAGLSSEPLPGRAKDVLSRGGLANPDVLLLESPDGPRVLKDYTPRAAWVRRWLAPWLVRRERAAIRALDRHPLVPRVLGDAGPCRLLLEYRPGELLSRSLRGRLPAGFLAELRQGVEAMHAAGVVHLDLRHRSNVLAGADGRPVLLDFASALRFRPGSWGARWVLPLFAWVDEWAVRKWERKLGG